MGYECAMQIAKRQGTVHLVCRNKIAGQKALEEIKEATKNDNVHLHIVDVSRPKQILEFTNNFSNPLNVLVSTYMKTKRAFSFGDSCVNANAT